MKKTTLFLIANALALNLVFSQGNLEFSKALIIGTAKDTVPPDKIWKVTSIYGSDRICIPSSYPSYHACSGCANPNYVAFTGASMAVNGVSVFSDRKFYLVGSTTQIYIYSNSTCTTEMSSGYQKGWAAFDINANPNILPMWLPEGTTLQSPSANIFISVLEFSIIP